MFGHLRYESVTIEPASISVSIRLLKMRVTGLTITDDMGMLENSGMDQSKP